MLKANMYHRPIEHLPDCRKWGDISDPSRTKAYAERTITRGAKHISMMPPMSTTDRYGLHTRISCSMLSMLVAVAFFLGSPACYAEHADRDKPLLLEADQVLIDDMHKTSTFTGNVRLSQGTMLIRGEKIEVMKYSDGFQQAKAYGNTASFRQKRDGSDEYLEGYGERIEYDTRAGTVDFFGQARVKREMDEVRGDHITYNMKTETFQVSGGASSVDTPPKRVRAVLQPRQKSDTSGPVGQGTPEDTPGKTTTKPE